MQLKNITHFLCNSKECQLRWRERKGSKCATCGQEIKAGASCKQETKNSTLYSCYRPPRPFNMSPVAYYRKYGCVDHLYSNVTNGRYYCNPAHCSKSWYDKEKRDEHLKRAFGALM